MNENGEKDEWSDDESVVCCQPGSRALRASGTAATGCVWRRTICVTATTTVSTEVTSFLRTAPANKRRHELCHSFRLFENEGCAPSQNKSVFATASFIWCFCVGYVLGCDWDRVGVASCCTAFVYTPPHTHTHTNTHIRTHTHARTHTHTHARPPPG